MMVITRRNPHQSALNTMKKPLTILSVLMIAALTMGMAVAQHMEQRAQQDRLSFGDTAQ
jgi:hypothetical protein